MEDFYIGGASVKLFLPIFKMNFPEIVDIALPAEGVFHNLVFVSIRKTYPMQAYKIMHGLWGMGQMMFTKYIIVVDDDVDVHNTSEVLFRLCANTDPQRDSMVAVRQDSPKARPTCSTPRRAKSPAAANSASTRRRNCRAKVSNANGRAHQDGCSGEGEGGKTFQPVAANGSGLKTRPTENPNGIPSCA